MMKTFLLAAVASSALAMTALDAQAHPRRFCDDDGHCWRSYRHHHDWDGDRSRYDHSWRRGGRWDDHYGRAPHRDWDRDRDFDRRGDRDRDWEKRGERNGHWGRSDPDDGRMTHGKQGKANGKNKKN